MKTTLRARRTRTYKVNRGQDLTLIDEQGPLHTDHKPSVGIIYTSLESSTDWN